jgi:hypothetical protein
MEGGGDGAISSVTAQNSFGAKVVHHFTRLFSIVSNAPFQVFTERKYHSVILSLVLSQVSFMLSIIFMVIMCRLLLKHSLRTEIALMSFCLIHSLDS